MSTQQLAEPSLKHQIEDVLRDTKTLTGMKIEGLNHKITAFTRAPILLAQALAEITALEQRHADSLSALARMTDQRDEALGGQPAIDLPQHRLRNAIQEAAEYNEMIPLHTDDPHVLHYQQMVKRWLDGKGMHQQQVERVLQLVAQLKLTKGQHQQEVDRVQQLLAQLKDATQQCGAMADLLREVRGCVEWSVTSGTYGGDAIERIDALLAGKETAWIDSADLRPVPAGYLALKVDLDHLKTQLHRRSFHTLMALADTLEKPFNNLAIQLDGKTLISTNTLRSLASEMLTLPTQACGLSPIEGDQLPALGERVHIHLASIASWAPYTVVGFYAWGDLGGDDGLHRVFVRLVSATGTENCRLLKDIRRDMAPVTAEVQP